MTTQSSNNAVRAAIAKATALFGGSEAALARAAGYSQNAIWAANKKGRMTLDMAIRIDRATKGTVPNWLSRPDAFSEPKTASPDNTAGHAGGSSPDPILDTELSPQLEGRPDQSGADSRGVASASSPDPQSMAPAGAGSDS